jgi:predicted GNAT family acetyltransferase
MIFDIEVAQPHHAHIIADFQLKMALETEGIQLDKPTVLIAVTSVFDFPEKGNYFTASIDNTVIASTLITYEWSDWRNKTIWWIQSVYVLPEFRRRGIFKQIYSHLQSLVNENPDVVGLRLYVDKSNKTAQKTYENLGMNGQHYQLFEWMK